MGRTIKIGRRPLHVVGSGMAASLILLGECRRRPMTPSRPRLAEAKLLAEYKVTGIRVVPV